MSEQSPQSVPENRTPDLGPSVDYDPVNRPKHYVNQACGIEPIEICEHMGFNLGNVVKYVMRHDKKNGIEDLKKARWYLDREIKKQEGGVPQWIKKSV